MSMTACWEVVDFFLSLFFFSRASLCGHRLGGSQLCLWLFRRASWLGPNEGVSYRTKSASAALSALLLMAGLIMCEKPPCCVTLLWYHIALGSVEMRSTNGSFRGGTEHEQMVAVHVVRLVMGKENPIDCLIGLWYTKMENTISQSSNCPSAPVCTTIVKCQHYKLYNLETKLHLMQNSLQNSSVKPVYRQVT